MSKCNFIMFNDMLWIVIDKIRDKRVEVLILILF